MCSMKDYLSFPPEYYQPGDLVIGGLVSHLFSPGDFISFKEIPETKSIDKPISHIPSLLLERIIKMVPNEEVQYTGVVQLLLYFEWMWTGIIAMDDDQGIDFIQTLTPKLSHGGICTAFIERIPSTLSALYDLAALLEHVDIMMSSFKKTNVVIISAQTH
ncbi:hypothetical protein E2320_002983, partial [Naja naja]